MSASGQFLPAYGLQKSPRRRHCADLTLNGQEKGFIQPSLKDARYRSDRDSLYEANWTYLSPAAFYDPDGARTGAYKLGGDVMVLNGAGESYVSYADYAIAMIDEIRNRAYVGKRFSVVAEKR